VYRIVKKKGSICRLSDLRGEIMMTFHRTDGGSHLRWFACGVRTDRPGALGTLGAVRWYVAGVERRWRRCALY
jgi:hypothetical protein